MKRLITPTLFLLGAALAAGGCASAPKARVIQRQDGSSEVIASAKKDSEATIAAVDQADSFCRKRGMEAVFSDNSGKDQCGPEQARKSLELLKRMPIVGKMLGKDDSSDDSQIMMSFNCKQPGEGKG